MYFSENLNDYSPGEICPESTLFVQTIQVKKETEDKIAEQNKKDRRTLVSAILLALFIIICMVGLILVFTLLEPHEYIDVFENKHEVDIAGILREARECMKNLPHN